MKCSTCKFYADSHCRLNPTAISTTPDWFCHQWRNNAVMVYPSALKVTDRQVFDAFAELPESGFCLALADAKEQLSARFGTCERTVEMRIKRLISLRYIEIVPVDWTKRVQIRYCVDEKDTSGAIKPRPWDSDPSVPDSHGNKKWTKENVVSVMRADELLSFSDLARKLPEVSRGSFVRILGDALSCNAITKTAENLYRLT